MLRVRGIYSTALTRLLTDMGYSFSDITPVIKKRFGNEVKLSDKPPRVTIKDREDLKGIVIIGEKDPSERIFYSLINVIPGTTGFFTTLGPYTSLAVKIKDRTSHGYRVLLPGGIEGTLLTRRNLKREKIVKAHVIKPHPRHPLLKEGIALVGSYIRVIENTPHTVSNYIKSEEKKLELLQLAFRYASRGWGIKFRSSASLAGFIEITEEIEKLLKLGKTLSEKTYTEPTLIIQGDSFGNIIFPPDAQMTLDLLRSKQVTTVPLHHTLKSIGDRNLDEKIDFSEKIVNKRDCFSRKALRKIYGSLLGRKDAVLLVHHFKIIEKSFTWTGVLEEFTEESLVLRREITKEGIYDGIKVKKEPGDRVISYTAMFSRFILHSYFSRDGALKGLYINLNTPLAIYDRSELWYVDLEADIIWTINGGVEIVDLEKWRKLVALHAIHPSLALEYSEFMDAIKEEVGTFSGSPDLIEKLFFKIRLREREVFGETI